MYFVTEQNVKISMPRYYKDRIYYEQERAALRDVYEILAHDQMLEKLNKQSFKEARNEQAAIDLAFDKMYHSSLKQLV